MCRTRRVGQGARDGLEVQPAGLRLGHAVAVRDPRHDHGLVEAHVLAQIAAAEAGAPAGAERRVELCVRLAAPGEGVLAEGEQVFAAQAAHEPPPVLPTVTLRNRAGEAPCATCMSCIGSPLPQFMTPFGTQNRSSATASHEPQNSGVML